MLLAALLGVSQGVWANGSSGGPKAVRLNINGTDNWYNVYSTTWSYTPTCTNYTTIKSATSFSGASLGDVTTLYISGFASLGWTDNSDWLAAQLDYQIGTGATTSIPIGGYGSGCSSTDVACTKDNDRVCGYVGWSSSQYNILSGLTPGSYTLKLTPHGQLRYNCGSWNQNDHSTVSASFTVPGWTSNGSQYTFAGSVLVGSNTSTNQTTSHYGDDDGGSVSITDTDNFSVTKTSMESYTVTFHPTSSGTKTATVTLTDKYGKTYTRDFQGTGSCGTTITIGNSGNVTVTTTPVGDTSNCPGTKTLSVSASGGIAPLSYQWYKNTVNSTSGGVAVSEKQTAAQGGDSYNPTAYDAGSLYYYCTVRSSGECESVNPVTSNTASVTIATGLALSPLTQTVKSYEPVTITATNANVETWSLSPAEGDTQYLYESNKRRTKFKGVGDDPAITYTITGAARAGLFSCPGVATVVVEEDDDCEEP